MIFDLQVREYAGGQSLTGDIHPLVKLYHLMSIVKFAHLPWPGALCDQHPEVIDAIITIRTAVAEEEERRQKEQANKSKRHR